MRSPAPRPLAVGAATLPDTVLRRCEDGRIAAMSPPGSNRRAFRHHRVSSSALTRMRIDGGRCGESSDTSEWCSNDRRDEIFEAPGQARDRARPHYEGTRDAREAEGEDRR